MTFNAGCWRRRLAVLVIATSWLTGCATAGFETGGLGACPPIVEYSSAFQARAAEELALLPDGSAIVGMMGDYAVIRNQVRACAHAPRDRRSVADLFSGTPLAGTGRPASDVFQPR